ncbi:MAG: hypothetical protein GDA50_07430 [Alphaproteobacteria bacterium GM202ARS2]|nr:hypothetical protein [Alphaproteobacteria bacterium GM202ARS2]
MVEQEHQDAPVDERGWPLPAAWRQIDRHTWRHSSGLICRRADHPMHGVGFYLWGYSGRPVGHRGGHYQRYSPDLPKYKSLAEVVDLISATEDG